MLNVTPETAVKIILILLYAFGAYQLTGVVFAPLLRRWRSQGYLGATPKASLTDEYASRFTHLELLLRATSHPTKFTRTSVAQFLTLSGSLFFLAYFVLLVGSHGQLPGGQLGDWWNPNALLMGILTAAIPYALKQIQLQMIRNANSYALIDATELLLMKYRTPGYEANLYHVLSELTTEIEGPMKRTFFSMVTLLQVEGRTAMPEAAELFVYQIKNTWSRQLGILLIKAALENRNIERALVKLHEDMTEGKQIVEGEKTEYMESIIMGFFPLVIVPSILFFMNDLFDGSVSKMLWTNPAVFQGLVLCIFFIFVGLATSLVLSKPKIEV
ncbi:hypothetical protein PAT3040_02659 [Paenibacillus agaridevorans]|uniref:Type II secretion system protein GspF domain-containing protein n=1 Tax=Paenibacillus agaridevorans TaxID=171404 RepID=A0A2R5EN71_9BACL|nr:hypothetical protein [Paenibacillus agaridevorans]GBG08092.1 hypothetical protein PAT3040_02659 [Paenibacillus agaridevorans]